MNEEARIQEIETGAISMDAVMSNLDDILLEDLDVQELNAIEELEPEAIEELEELDCAPEELEELSESDEAALDLAEIRDEVYATGEASDTVPVEEPEAVAKAPKERKARDPSAKKAKSPATPKVPAVERSLSALPESVFVLDAVEPADLTANKLAVLAARPTQKKIGEKFDNFFPALNANRAPSVYGMHIFRALNVASAGSMTMKDMVAALQANGYTIGTARSQAGQIAFLFMLLRVTEHVGGAYKLIPGSPIAAKLNALATLAA